MDNPEKMAGYTRRRGNQRWTIQRKWQHRVQDEENKNEHTTQYVLDTTMHKQTQITEI